MAHILGCDRTHLEYPTKRVFDAVTLGIDEGDRIGVVGGNGDGKSTLLGLLAGQILPDSGRVVRRGGITIGSLAQSDSLAQDATVGHCVVGARAEHVWASEPRVRAIISGLIADIGWDIRIGELSGGQRRRVDLARVLIADSDILMLDEPTNHLDVRAINWLAEHLKCRWPRSAGALLVVTHDRWFLDEVCTSMWEVHDGQVDEFEGGYSAYVLQRVEREAATRAAESKRRNRMRTELAWLSRGPRARSTKPKFRVDAAQALIADEPPVRDSLELRRTAMSRLGKQVVSLDEVTLSYRDAPIIDSVTWHIGPGDRFGILGENGSGKTTLLRLIQGSLSPTAGSVTIGKTVRFAFLSQHLDELEALGDQRVREVLARYQTRYEFDGKELTPAQLLERLGFAPEQLSVAVSALSGGQKRRLQLMLILLEKPNVLILDEPDNDLDIDMLALVEALLDTWPGTLLLISHDRHLLERVTDDQFALIDGKVRHVPGGVDEFLSLVDATAEASGRSQGVCASASAEQRDVRDSDAQSPTPENRTGGSAYQLRKELASTERKLETLCKRVDAAREELHRVDPSDYVALLEHQEKLREVQRQLAEMEDEWVRVSERLAL